MVHVERGIGIERSRVLGDDRCGPRAAAERVDCGHRRANDTGSAGDLVDDAPDERRSGCAGPVALGRRRELHGEEPRCLEAERQRLQANEVSDDEPRAGAHGRG